MSESTPRCVGFIMDGNRRWAKARGMGSALGHVAGYEKMKEVASWVKEAGIQYGIIYALSTENWKRDPEEVEHLLSLFRLLITEFLAERAQGQHQGTHMRFIGDLSRFPEDLQIGMKSLEEVTASEAERTLAIAVSYGGRAEILAAARQLVAEGVGENDIDEVRFEKALWTAGIPDPDLIIRTGGSQRLSNFLPWQSVYSELFFLGTLWPDFSQEDFTRVLEEYALRTRNFGA